MTYSVTGIRTSPDIGFQTGRRHTAEGARDLAITYLAEGLQEIEVRDHYGNLRSMAELERKTLDDGADERVAAERLAALN